MVGGPGRRVMASGVMAGLLGLAILSSASCFAEEQGPELHFFYAPSCSDCRKIRRDVVHPLVDANPEIQFHEYSLSDPEATELLIEYYVNYGVPEERWGGNSAAFTGDLAFVGTEEVEEKLPRAAEKLLEQGGKGPDEWEPSDPRSRMEDIFDRFGVPAVAAAGLADGVNPCALAALVFLLSLLSISGRTSREILATGLLYAAGVFVAYFGAGFGIFKGLRALTGFELAARMLYPLAAVGTLVLTVLTFRDYLRARAGSPDAIAIKLPKPLLKAGHAVTRTLLRGRWFLVLAVVAGAAVSLLELFCTGQIYLPTLIYLSSQGELLGRVILMLALYVAMFTLPVIALTLAVWAGVSSERLRSWAREHTATSKLAMTVVFALLTVALIAVAMGGVP